jgi:glycosyltransferase involved in cell wall biosynthesis
MSGYSCCIITHGQRPAKLERLIESIHAQRFPAYEVIVCGALPAGWMPSGYTFIRCEAAARAGRLGLLRNTAARLAAFDTLIMLDDDLYLHDDFYTGLANYGPDFDLLSCRILNPDGTRFWDWKAHHGHDWLLEYNETSPYVSLTGGFVVAKRTAWERVQWDETRGFYEAEDVDFSERARAAGLRIAFNPHSTVTHDGSYTQRGKGVYRIG